MSVALVDFSKFHRSFSIFPGGAPTPIQIEALHGESGVRILQGEAGETAIDSLHTKLHDR